MEQVSSSRGEARIMSRNPVPPRVPPTGEPTAAAKLPTAGGAAPVDSGPVIVARPDFWYRAKRYVMVLALLGVGPWFGYDGWKGWPERNQQIAQRQKQLEHAQQVRDEKQIDELNHDPLTHEEPHSDLALEIQKVLAFALPIGGILFLIWTLRASRGTYRLTGDTLDVPGHPPVRLSEITEIDSSKWDRKGIAYLRYRTASGASGKLTLDDFIYEREPTDQIYDLAVATIHPRAEG
jgi:hypothetical protein